MNKRRSIAIRALVVFMVVASLTLVVHHTQPKVGQIQMAGQITGNTELAPAPSTYTVLAVPNNWRQDAKSMGLVDGFSQKSNMVAMRQHSSLEVYSAKSDNFRANWADLCPEVDAGLPVVVVMHNGQKVYKRTGGTADQVNQDLAHVVSNLDTRGRCPNCPQCRPFRPKPSPNDKPKPNDDDAPKVAPIADTQAANTDSGRNTVGLALLLGAVAGAVTIVTEFRNRAGF